MVRKTVMSQLQSVGESALGKAAQSPVTRTAVQGAIQVKERGERILHTLDSIEERLGAIERRLADLEHAKPPSPPPRASRPPSGAAGTKTAAPKPAAAKPKPDASAVPED